MVALLDAPHRLVRNDRALAWSCRPAHAALVVGSDLGVRPRCSTSTTPTSVFDLDDPDQLRVVYAAVLREGSEVDVREWIHQPTLLRIWDTLWVPPSVHEAWDSWIGDRLERAAV